MILLEAPGATNEIFIKTALFRGHGLLFSLVSIAHVSALTRSSTTGSMPLERANNRNNGPSPNNKAAATFWGPMKLKADESCDTAVFICYLKHHVGLLYSVSILNTRLWALVSLLCFLEKFLGHVTGLNQSKLE